MLGCGAGAGELLPSSFLAPKFTIPASRLSLPVAFFKKSQIKIRESIMNACVANGKGGAIFSVENIALTVKTTTIQYCTAEEAGGVYVSSMEQTTKITDSVIENCTASGNVGGGGLSIFKTKNVHVDCSSFVGNKAFLGGGGGIYWSFPKEEMSSATLESPILFKTCLTLPSPNAFFLFF